MIHDMSFGCPKLHSDLQGVFNILVRLILLWKLLANPRKFCTFASLTDHGLTFLLMFTIYCTINTKPTQTLFMCVTVSAGKGILRFACPAWPCPDPGEPGTYFPGLTFD